MVTLDFPKSDTLGVYQNFIIEEIFMVNLVFDSIGSF